MIVFETVQERAGLERAWAVRHEVFVLEQGVPLDLEVDDLDTAPTTTHVLASRDGTAVATGRVIYDPSQPGVVHVGRVAVRARERGRGVGAALMAHLEGVALAQHGERDGDVLSVRIELSAQETAMGFYRRLGYTATTGARYLDAGIWHQDMERRAAV